MEEKRKQAYDNKLHVLHQIENENKKRYKSNYYPSNVGMNKKLEEVDKKKEKKRLNSTFQSTKKPMHVEHKKARVSNRLERLSKPKSDEEKSIDEKLKEYNNRMHEVENRKQHAISNRLKHTTIHLEKVNEIK
jgi:hypothetical protein